MSHTFNIGDLVAQFLHAIDTELVFGIISVHNIPIMDGIARQGGIRVVMTRGEMGAAHMADGYARRSGKLGVLVSSTGPGAANTVSGLLEASFASTPLLHITGQVPRKFLGRDTGATHNVRDQLGMLQSVCKASYRIERAEDALRILQQAATEALAAPMGPVSIEIPIDVQKQPIPQSDAGASLALPPMPARPRASDADIAQLAERVRAARRPMLWVGRGAIDCGAPLQQLLDRGFGMASSWAGRGIVPEDHACNLGGLNGTGAPEVIAFYESVDLMVVVGSRLRGQETVDQSLALPSQRVQIDLDPAAEGRSYDCAQFVCGDARDVLERLVAALGNYQAEPGYREQFANMKQRARQAFAGTLGPYAGFAEQLRSQLPRNAVWARDITVANSTWGNRLFEVYGPRDAMHPVGAGIGQGLPLGIGAAFAARGAKTVVLSGDAGFMMNVCELWTAMQEQLDMLLIVMNDAGYGVIKHMQDANFGGRRVYGDLAPPDFALLAQSAGMAYRKLGRADGLAEAVAQLAGAPGLAILEVDMLAIGEAPPYFPYQKS
ncbi:thiamine pyrophosphate-binding protein [Comamonas sp. B21-038]|uniref:thiamine pyrophosphate-binding protein n=1 Tax=Comamonas sp. B21-038 TaxID=2918299 RepID=UPI001EFB7D99|nr:thiamine pyrophosphate-binding protein [Comamonas sp. B21-038]ULR87662.1 thiamine pyrophosphate-binding protein [Comamonas sp. B21-038]